MKGPRGGSNIHEMLQSLGKILSRHPSSKQWKRFSTTARRPLDPEALNCLAPSACTFKQVLGREMFLSHFLPRLVIKNFVMERRGPGAASGKAMNRFMALVGEPGCGKTTIIGMLMGMVRAIDDGGSREVEEFLFKKVPEEYLQLVIRYLRDYIVIPVTFNIRQAWSPEEECARISVVSRLLHSIFLARGDNVTTLWAIQKSLNGTRIDASDVVRILDGHFKGDAKYIIAVDEFGHLRDAELKSQAVSFLGEIMDCRPGSFVILSSLESDIIRDSLSQSCMRFVDRLPLSPVPELLMVNDKIRSHLNTNPGDISMLLDASSNPRFLVEDGELLEETLESDYIEWLKRPVYHEPLIRQFFNAGNTELIENFITMLLDSKVLSADTVVSSEMGVRVSELADRGLFTQQSVASNLNESKFDYVAPIAPLPVIAGALTRHPLILDAKPTGALWALALTTIRPWPVNEGERFELFMALLECVHRTSAANEGDYFQVSDVDLSKDLVPQPPPIVKLAFVKNDEVESLIKDMQRLLPGRTTQLQQVICKLKSPDNIRSLNQSVFEQMSDEDLKEFSKGHMLLMNSNYGPGFDFAVMDGDCLVFVEVKYSKRKDDKKHGCSMTRQEIEAKRKLCEMTFEHVRKRCPDYKDFCLALYSYRKVDFDLMMTFSRGLEKINIVGPKQILAMIPMTFRSRFEFLTGRVGAQDPMAMFREIAENQAVNNFRNLIGSSVHLRGIQEQLPQVE